MPSGAGPDGEAAFGFVGRNEAGTGMDALVDIALGFERDAFHATAAMTTRTAVMAAPQSHDGYLR